MKLARLRPVFDLLVLLAFFAAAGYAGYYYLFPQREPTAAKVVLEPDAGGIDLQQLLDLARNAPPSAILPDWTPDSLSNRWRNIVIHHSASLSGNSAIFNSGHQKRGMENGLAYHFVLCNGHGGEDGLVEIGERWRRQLAGGHVRGDDLNNISIGICLVGDFTSAPPTARQISSLKALLMHLLQLTELQPSQIIGHKNLPGQATACPGLLPVDEIIRSLPQPGTR